MALVSLDDFSTSLDPIAVINLQPVEGTNGTLQNPRRLIPISTINLESNESLQFVPQQGIDVLRDVDQLLIQQTIELNDMLSGVNSENRYKIMIPHSETLFYASEISSETQRLACGANRGFTMVLHDRTQQEALTFKRSTTCGCCSFWCIRPCLEIWLPYEYAGRVKQNFSITSHSFSIMNSSNVLIYSIHGPASFSFRSKESHFKIYSGDGFTQLGSINHTWDQVLGEYTISVQFPNRSIDVKEKALITGAAFLLEYMFFISAKKSGSCLWC